MAGKLILLESSLELVPKELWSHPDIIRTAKRYGIKPSDILLEKSLHYHAMSSLSRKWKRGRPDIVHITLLTIMDSPIVRKGFIETYIHTLDNRVFKVKNNVRIPKSYERFRGLMAQLLKEERVPLKGEPLIFKTHDSLRSFVEDNGKIILLRERGTPATPDFIFTRFYYSGKPLGIGAFPRGEFKKSTLRKADEEYSIYGGAPLKAWTVASRILCAGERILLGWR